jgi:quercetin dioxygenase-like cupin family protein
MSDATPGNERTTRGGDERVARPLDAALSVVMIEEAAVRLRNEQPYRDGDRNTVTLAKNGPLRVQLVALKRGARLHENDPEGALSVHVLEGSARVTVAGSTEEVTKGSLAILAAGQAWEVTADEESLLLVQLSWPPEAADSPGRDRG